MSDNTKNKLVDDMEIVKSRAEEIDGKSMEELLEEGVVVELDMDALQSHIDDFEGTEKAYFEALESERRFVIKLRECRKAKGLTQKDVAKMTGLSQQVISRMEKMDCKPSLTNLMLYINALGLDMLKIFED